MALLFSKILEEAALKNKVKYGSKEMKQFLRDKALQATSRNVKPQKIINTKKAAANIQELVMPGRMVCYFYDPKTKDKLPYWDKFPVVFPIEHYSDGFLGLNMHYLPPQYRALLMDKLYSLLNNKRYDATTKLKINYQILSAAAKFKFFKPCLKRYLYSHVKSQIVQIESAEWEYVAFLPLARFQKSTNMKVWRDSVAMLKEGNK